MKRNHVAVTLALLFCSVFTQAQQTVATNTNVAVPPLVNFTGVLTDVNGKPLTGVVGVTFSLYKDQQGGSPLWLETQNVKPNATGHYTVMLGSTTSQGVPASVFASGQAHWLEVQAEGLAEQPRVLLVSAPYALKAGDAETLGGKPASAFMPASGNAASGNNMGTNTVTGGGTTDYIPLWLSKTKLGNSKLFQSTAGDLGIGTTTPTANLDVNGTSDIRNTLTLFPNGSAPTLSVNGTAFNVSNTGTVSFVSGQTFPGAGTVTSVGTGLGLKGGPITGSGTLTIDTTAVPQLNASNSFTGNQTIAGDLAISANSNTGEVLNITQSGGGDGINVGALNGFTAVNAVALDQGVSGTANSTSGGGIGVSGFATSGYGVYGQDNAASGPSVGVYGTTSSATGFGVYGTSEVGVGLYGTSSGLEQLGVVGIASGAHGLGGLFDGGPSGNGEPGGPGVGGQGGSDLGSNGAGSGGDFAGGNSANSYGGYGIFAEAGSGSGLNTGIALPVAGVAGIGPLNTAGSATDGPGVFGSDGGLSSTGALILGENLDIGVWGDADVGDYGVLGTAGSGYGVIAANTSANVPALEAVNYSTSNTAAGLVVALDAVGGQTTIGAAGCPGTIYWGFQLGQSGMSNCTNYTLLGDGLNTFINAGNGTTAGQIFFRVNNGNNKNISAMNVNTDGSVTVATLDVTTKLTKPAGSFKIDHPLDPANKYLYHSFVESPDMKNIYDGVAELDQNGEAVVVLPEYFQALNRDFRYQLTTIGGFAPVYIAQEVENNQFKIAGGKPGIKVSWQVTGVRQDAFANAYRIQAEVDKAPEDRGHYLHPELFGAPDTDRIGYAVPVPPEYPKGGSLERRPDPQPNAVAAARRRLLRPRPQLPVLPKRPTVTASPKPGSAPAVNQK